MEPQMRLNVGHAMHDYLFLMVKWHKVLVASAAVFRTDQPSRSEMIDRWFRLDLDGDILLTTKHVMSSDGDGTSADRDEDYASRIEEDTLLDPDVFLAV